MNKATSVLFPLLLAVVFFGSQSLFIVPEMQQAMVLQFGNPVAKYTTPGLKVKIPFIQNVQVLDKRMLDVDPPPEEVILADQKRLVVDTFARYRINDMLAFYTTLSTEQQANSRLNNIINSTMRSVMGNATLADVLSEKRSVLMSAIKEQVNRSVSSNGVEIVDVRIGRADLPEQTSQSIFARMRTEREREAAEFRAQGQEQAQEIKSKADKERTVLLAEAEKTAQQARGQGDSSAIKIYADAFQKDPAFYEFYRTLEAYRQSLSGSDTTFVLSPKGAFFQYFNGGQVK
jgi:modulator of FtsH protease HflC